MTLIMLSGNKMLFDWNKWPNNNNNKLLLLLLLLLLLGLLYKSVL